MDRRERAGLSRRAERMLAEPPFPEYIREHTERIVDRFDAETNPDGYIPFGIAENHLVTQRLIDRLAEVDEVPTRVLGYDSGRGNPAFRANISAFLARNVFGRGVDPERMSVLAGAGSVLELVFHAICDPGDGVLVPTPSYSGFWPDLTMRDEATIVPVHTRADEGFALSVDALERARDGADCEVKALLLTNPDNPTGRVMSASQVESLVTWATDAGLHVVVDEVYALSVFGDDPFMSIASIRPVLGENVHVVWAFSKDFGASGLRCGVLVTENDDLLQAVDALSYWCLVSGHTQFLLSEILADTVWVDEYLAANRDALRDAYGRTTAALDAASIDYVPADAGFFILCDLREHLAAPTWEAEYGLWRTILDDTNVNLTPGSACRVDEPGFFRICYAAGSVDTVEEGLRRVERVLRSRTDELRPSATPRSG